MDSGGPAFLYNGLSLLFARRARLWWAGIDPYAMRPRAPFWHLWPLWDRLFYPLPALFIVGPFAAFGARAAQTAFVATVAGLLAWRLTRDALWPLLLFCTPSFLMAAWLGQWSPWLTLAALVPGAAFLLAAKPTLGLACFLYRPTWTAVASATAIGVLSLAAMPDWPLKWLDNLHSVLNHPPPILAPSGWVVALAVLRWRQPEARLLLAMASVPQLALFSDQLPLFLVCRTRREALFYIATSITVFLTWTMPAQMLLGESYVMLGCYLPALYLVVRRPNEGAVTRLAGAQDRVLARMASRPSILASRSSTLNPIDEVSFAMGPGQ